MVTTKKRLSSQQTTPAVYIVDDDVHYRRSISALMQTVNLPVQCYASARDFLDGYDPGRPGCLILEVRLPGMSGLQLLHRLTESDIHLPIIVVTAHASVATTVEAMKAGAVELLEKPPPPQQLLDRVQQALEWDQKHRAQRAELALLHLRFAALSPREYEVLQLMANGCHTKQIARELQISPTTVDFHRRNLRRKMDVDTSFELGQLFEAYRRSQLAEHLWDCPNLRRFEAPSV